MNISSRLKEVTQVITEAIQDVPGIRALFLSGSFGNGMADEYSDIDFVMVAKEGASDAVAKSWREAVSQTGDIVLWWDRSSAPILINAITEDWTRTDVIILKPDQSGSQTQSSLKPLFDHDNIFEGLAKTAQKSEPDLNKFRYEVENFIRILGLLHLAAGRKEYINGVNSSHRIHVRIWIDTD